MSENRNSSGSTNFQKQDELPNLQEKKLEYLDKIKKEKREEAFNTDRLKNFKDEKEEMQIESPIENKQEEENKQLEELVNQWQENPFREADFIDLASAIDSGDRLRRHYGLIGLGKLIQNKEGKIPINAGLVRKLKAFIQMKHEPILQRESANIIQSLSSGATKQVEILVDEGLVADLIHLVKSTSKDIFIEAIWALGNIASNNPRFRDLILKENGLPSLINSIINYEDRELLLAGMWAISSLTQGHPAPSSHDIEPAISILIIVIQKIEDLEILTDAFWGLSNLSDSPAQAKRIAAFGIIPRLVFFLQSYPNTLLISPCLRTLGNIFSSMDREKNIKEYGSDLVPTLFKMAQNLRVSTRTEALWVLSNIIANTLDAADMIMNNPYYVDMLIKIATSDIPYVSLEVVWIFSFIVKTIQQEQVLELCDLGVLDCLLHLLTFRDNKVLQGVLDTLRDILDWGTLLAREKQIENPILILIEDKGGIHKLEALQQHPQLDIYTKVLKILEDFCDLEKL